MAGDAQLDAQMNETLRGRFAVKVGPASGAQGCRMWRGRLSDGGYGEIRLGGKGTRKVRAHALAYRFKHGVWPRPCCLHICDNPPCCEPDHLVAGTNAENTADMLAKGRHQAHRGTEHAGSKLTDGAVLAIRASTEPQAVVAARYGVARSLVSGIKAGRRWAHVQG